jgi:hypothetical protein
VKTTASPIPQPAYQAQQLIIDTIQDAPLGTKRGIYSCLFSIMAGHLRQTRGALIPALDKIGLTQNECLRAREAVAEGVWTTQQLLKRFHETVAKEQKWQPLVIGGFKVNAIDNTCTYRPRLQNCDTKHYNSTAKRALPAVNFGLCSAVGLMDGQKVTLPRLIVRGDDKAKTDQVLMEQLCELSGKILNDKDLAVADRKFPVMFMLEKGIKNIVTRRQINITARRTAPEIPEGQTKVGRPAIYGDYIRPVARTRKGKEIPATEPDEVCEWKDKAGNLMQASVWKNVVLQPQKGWSDERKALNLKQKWILLLVKHPKYPEPMIILMNVDFTPEQGSDAMRGRWGVEQLPLVAKQTLGGHRMFVHNKEMIFRFPELIFIGATLLTYLAGTCEAMPTGWWDREPQPTAGRMMRKLNEVARLADLGWPEQLRKKQSATAQLPHGYDAVRQKRSPA